jgi:hypothetical protein
MTRFTTTLALLALLLGACASTPPTEPASVVDIAQDATHARSDICSPPRPGQVCVRFMDVNRETPCTCVDGAAVRRLPLWPESLRADY